MLSTRNLRVHSACISPMEIIETTFLFLSVFISSSYSISMKMKIALYRARNFSSSYVRNNLVRSIS
jgi:hypothetical protein